jgi:hypothetical protein
MSILTMTLETLGNNTNPSKIANSTIVCLATLCSRRCITAFGGEPYYPSVVSMGLEVKPSAIVLSRSQVPWGRWRHRQTEIRSG